MRNLHRSPTPDPNTWASDYSNLKPSQYSHIPSCPCPYYLLSVSSVLPCRYQRNIGAHRGADSCIRLLEFSCYWSRSPGYHDSCVWGLGGQPFSSFFLTGVVNLLCLFLGCRSCCAAARKAQKESLQYPSYSSSPALSPIYPPTLQIITQIQYIASA